MNSHIRGSALSLLGLIASVTCLADESYRDLNKNGLRDVYEDGSRPVEQRVDDLIDRMTVAEKAGQMFINRSIVNDDASLGYISGSGPERHDALDAIKPSSHDSLQHLGHIRPGRIRHLAKQPAETCRGKHKIRNSGHAGI